ncbi:MAG: hypothetical protein GY942_18160, partial [Aestuariibacter sp.]|nr:hypothetical protein [Aestuariibacter sp.]
YFKDPANNGSFEKQQAFLASVIRYTYPDDEDNLDGSVNLGYVQFDDYYSVLITLETVYTKPSLLEVIRDADILSSTSPSTNISLSLHRGIDEIEKFGGVKTILLMVTDVSGINSMTSGECDALYERLHVRNTIDVVTVLMGSETINAHNSNPTHRGVHCLYDVVNNPYYDSQDIFKFSTFDDLPLPLNFVEVAARICDGPTQSPTDTPSDAPTLSPTDYHQCIMNDLIMVVDSSWDYFENQAGVDGMIHFEAQQLFLANITSLIYFNFDQAGVRNPRQNNDTLQFGYLQYDENYNIYIPFENRYNVTEITDRIRAADYLTDEPGSLGTDPLFAINRAIEEYSLYDNEGAPKGSQAIKNETLTLIVTFAYSDQLHLSMDENRCANVRDRIRTYKIDLVLILFNGAATDGDQVFSCLFDNQLFLENDHVFSFPSFIPDLYEPENVHLIAQRACRQSREDLTWSPTPYPTDGTTIPTSSPSKSPTLPGFTYPPTDLTSSPTERPTLSPTKSPTDTTPSPTDFTESPSRSPTKDGITYSPTDSTLSPTLSPSQLPTTSPTLPGETLPPSGTTLSPTDETETPSTSPTLSSLSPSRSPTDPGYTYPPSSLTHSPTRSTLSPTLSPTLIPSLSPTSLGETLSPTLSTLSPTESTLSPSQTPTDTSESPSQSPTMPGYTNPPSSQTLSPTESTKEPSNSPTRSTSSPTGSPTMSTTSPTLPTRSPSVTGYTLPPTGLTDSPSLSPTLSPSDKSASPSLSPTEPGYTLPPSSLTSSPSSLTEEPTPSPTRNTLSPTNSPTNPGYTLSPTDTTQSPSISTLSPSSSPSDTTLSPTLSPTETGQTLSPTLSTNSPSQLTLSPSDSPSQNTLSPSRSPTSSDFTRSPTDSSQSPTLVTDSPSLSTPSPSDSTDSPTLSPTLPGFTLPPSSLTSSPSDSTLPPSSTSKPPSSRTLSPSETALSPTNLGNCTVENLMLVIDSYSPYFKDPANNGSFEKQQAFLASVIRYTYPDDEDNLDGSVNLGYVQFDD